MKKRVLCSVLSCLLLTSMMLGLSPLSSALGSLSNFSKTRTYPAGTFIDVDPAAWYAGYVERAYEYGVIDGIGGGSFSPSGKVTIAEAVKLAACLHRSYYNGQTNFSGGNTWYEPYVRYARQNGIIKEDYPNYNAAATRADFAAIIGAALPDEAVTAINRIDDDALPDVLLSYSYGPSVYKLYRAGVLTGIDKRGTFYPGRGVQRAEAAAVCARMLDAEARVKQALAGRMTAEELYGKYVSAVFYIELFDKNDELIKTGSGFFISENGDAVTNFHVVVGAHSAKVTTEGGDVHDVLGIYDFDWKKDIAIINVDGGGFNYLPLGNSDNALTGETVYTIGSPLGLQNTMSRGIISSAVRFINGVQYIQTDAPLSHGSSGGPLLSTGGLVVGIVSAGADGGQNLNLAVPINLITALDRSECVPLRSIIEDAADYKAYPGVPDFGAYIGVAPYLTNDEDDYTEYSYKTSDFDKGAEETLDDYRLLLEHHLYSFFGYFEKDGNLFDAHYNPLENMLVLFGITDVDGTECVTVMVSATL